MKDILLVIDNINYRGGAHTAAAHLALYLVQCGHQVDIFSTDIPDEETRKRFHGCTFIAHPDCKRTTIYSTGLTEILKNSRFSIVDKLLKVRMTLLIRLLGVHAAFKQTVGCGNCTELASGYHCVAVMTENSVFREAVSRCTAPIKYQWVHIDYAAMRQIKKSYFRDTERDGEYWATFTKVIFISENARSGFLSVFPQFDRKKTMVLHNLLSMEHLEPYRKKAFAVHNPLALLTVARLDYQKNIGRSLRIAAALKDCGIHFIWRFVGDGREMARLKQQTKELNLTDCVQFTGYTNTPWSYAEQSDLFVLNSRFEGIPNVIFESFAVGLPVVSTAIAAIPEQIQDDVNGRLVPDRDADMISTLTELARHPDFIIQYEKKLFGYIYDNDSIQQSLKKLFCNRENGN